MAAGGLICKLCCTFLQERESTAEGNDDVEACDAELLDEMTTSRGELKLRTRSINDDRFPQARYFLSACNAIVC